MNHRITRAVQSAVVSLLLASAAVALAVLGVVGVVLWLVG